MTLTVVVVFGLATWRLSSLLVNEGGPFGVFLKLRTLAGITHDENGRPLAIPDNFFAQLFSCVWCASVWVGVSWMVFWLFSPDVAIKLAAVFAFSTIAIMLDTIFANR